MKPVVAYVKEYAQTTPEKTALIVDDIPISYAELWKRIRGFAAYLKSLNFEKGSRIVVKAFPTADFPVICFAVHLAGYTFVPIEKTTGPDGVKDIATTLSASLIISDQTIDTVAAFLPISDVQKTTSDNFDDSADFDIPDCEDYCDILFTTGTTGKSKGVLLTHRAVWTSSDTTATVNFIDENSVYLIATPINHAGGIRKLYCTMLRGGTVALVDGFMNLRRFYDAIEKYGVTATALPPSAVHVLLTVSAKQLEKYSDQIKTIHSGGAAFPETDKEALIRIFPNTHLIISYGSSEAGSVCSYDYGKYPGMTNCIGKVNESAEVLIVDDDRKPFKSSKEHMGLIAIGGNALMTGYYNAPELTEQILKDGILYTSDIGYIAEDGFVYMFGRKDDVINVGGLKIAPAEVENIVIRFPGVSECACFGVPDKITGSAPKLNIVTTDEFDMVAFRKYLQSKLEMFKIPKTISVVDELPKTYNGKLDRKRLS